jgi:hypothetical protein
MELSSRIVIFDHNQKLWTKYFRFLAVMHVMYLRHCSYSLEPRCHWLLQVVSKLMQLFLQKFPSLHHPHNNCPWRRVMRDVLVFWGFSPVKRLSSTGSYNGTGTLAGIRRRKKRVEGLSWILLDLSRCSADRYWMVPFELVIWWFESWPTW